MTTTSLTIDDILKEELAASVGSGCKVGRFLAGLDAPTKDTLTYAFTGDVYSVMALVRTLNRIGGDISRDGVRRHRETLRNAENGNRPAGCTCAQAGLL